MPVHENSGYRLKTRSSSENHHDLTWNFSICGINSSTNCEYELQYASRMRIANSFIKAQIHADAEVNLGVIQPFEPTPLRCAAKFRRHDYSQ
jgi:hypothetical protein